jgi:GEVED domain
VGATGNTYARFRLTSDSSINNNTSGGAASSGEVEDYRVAIAVASDPNLLLVKRITAINPGQADEIQFDNREKGSGKRNG